jgi:thiol-disulfide isomerase/thioredoxin
MRQNKKICLLALYIGLGAARVAMADLKIGDAFPDLAMCKLEGTLPESTKDKVVLVDFWASWCGPCAKSFPTMDELQKTYGPRGFVIVAVNVDEKKKDMDNFLQSHHVNFTVVRDAQQKLVEKTGISTMPSSFLLDKAGKVVYAHSGFHGAETKKEYAQEIETLLKQNPK